MFIKWVIILGDFFSVNTITCVDVCFNEHFDYILI